MALTRVPPRPPSGQGGDALPGGGCGGQSQGGRRAGGLHQTGLKRDGIEAVSGRGCCGVSARYNQMYIMLYNVTCSTLYCVVQRYHPLLHIPDLSPRPFAAFPLPTFLSPSSLQECEDRIRVTEIESQAMVKLLTTKWRSEFDKRKKLHNQVGSEDIRLSLSSLAIMSRVPPPLRSSTLRAASGCCAACGR